MLLCDAGALSKTAIAPIETIRMQVMGGKVSKLAHMLIPMTSNRACGNIAQFTRSTNQMCQGLLLLCVHICSIACFAQLNFSLSPLSQALSKC